MKMIRTLGLALLLGSSLTGQSGYAHSLPIGDGNLSTSAQQGSVYSCQTSFSSNAGGAQKSGDWFDAQNGTWDPDLKPIIDGSVSWPSEINITLEGNQRIITSNGLPDHATGTFPVSMSDDAYEYDRNPNSIQAQDILLRLDATPQIASEPTCVPMGMIGFTLSGAAIFNAVDAMGRDAPAHEIQDSCDGHPERSGQYHYHNLSSCLTDTQSGPDGHSDLLGYSLDGFGIFGTHVSNDIELTTSDLDECHGHIGKIEWDGAIDEMYHYHFSKDYPYTISCFVGEVTGNFDTTSSNPQAQQVGNADQVQNISSNEQLGPSGNRGGEILQIAADELGIPFETLRRVTGMPPPDFKEIAKKLGGSESAVRAAFQTARRQIGG